MEIKSITLKNQPKMTNPKPYKEFLEDKIVVAGTFGTEIDRETINVPTLFDLAV